MRVNEALLERHGSFQDEQLGISEHYTRLTVGGDWTVGVLSRPLGEARPLGWVVAHSFGPEQMELQMTEVVLARRLAAAGFPVLRFHCQGYGDSGSIDAVPDFSTHLRDTTDAVRHMQAVGGTPEVGLIGARLGGTVAAVVADRLQLSHLALVGPAVTGKRFATELLRVNRISEVAGEGGLVKANVDVHALLASGRALNVKGFMLTREAYEEMRGVDLVSLLERFAGRALVVQVSLTEKEQPSLAKLVARLREIGADATFRVVTDSFAPRFGSEHMRFVDTNLLKDMLTDLNRSLCETVLEWAGGAGARGANGGAE